MIFLLYTLINKELYSYLYDYNILSANTITYLRTTLIFPCIFFIDNNYIFYGISMILLNGIFDLIDGIVSRIERHKCNNCTLDIFCVNHDQIYGSFIDSISDKIFNIFFWCFLIQSNYDFIISLLIFFECILFTIRLIKYYNNEIVYADKFGKIKQFFQVSGNIFIIIYYPIGIFLYFISLFYCFNSIKNKIFNPIHIQ